MGLTKHTSTVRHDIVIIALIAIAILLLSVQFHFYDELFDYIAQHPGMFLEEIIFTLTTLSLLFAIFSYRRWRELNKEIQERNKAEASRFVTEQRSEALLTSIPNLTFRLRNDGIYLDFRAGSSDDLYGSIDNIIGSNINDRLPSDVAKLIMTGVEQALSTNTIQTLEYSLKINGKQKRFHARMIRSGIDEVFVYVRNLEDTEMISDALAQSETKFREVVENLSEGLIITDMNDNIIYMNKRMTDLSGWTFSEVKDKPGYTFFVPDDQQEEILRRNRSRGEGKTERYDIEMIRKDGKRFWAEVYGAPLRDSRKQIVGTIGTITDITERKWHERLQSALYRITDVTRSSEDIGVLFKSLHEIIGELMYAKNFYIALYDPVTRIISFPYFVDEVDPQPEPRSFSHGSTEYILESGNILHAPAPVFEELSEQGALDLIGAPAVDWLGVPLTAAGKTFGVMTVQSYDPKIIFTDREKEILIFVSQHISTAIQQKSEEERFRAVWEHSADGMRVTDKDGTIIMVNQAFCRMVNKEKSELIGESFEVMFDAELIKQQNAMEKYHKHFNNELFIPRTDAQLFLWDGKVINVEVSASFITVGINERMLLCIYRDTSDRKRLEEQLLHAQKMDSIGVLAGGIAHDFNNVLAMILGSAELVKKKATDHPDIQKFAQMIANAAERGSGIAKQLLLFARSEKGVKKPLSLSAVTLDVCKLLEHSIPKSISIASELRADHDTIMGDEDQLHQVIINLAVNAKDAIMQTKQNGTLTFIVDNVYGSELVKTFPSIDDSLYVALTVSDTGNGMDDATLRRMYEPFFSTKERGKGTGLGLSIVHGIVKSHSGLIDVHSEIGSGTAFTIYFPAIPSAEESHLRLHIDTDESVAAPSDVRKKVLIVDDEQDLVSTIDEILSNEGYPTLTANDGQQALARYDEEKNNIAVIISDLGMPNMDGRALLRELRNRNAEVSFVFMTGYLDSDAKQELDDLGVQHIILKPFGSEEVLAAIRRAYHTPETL